MFYYICAAMTAISACVSFGFSIEAFIKGKKAKDESFTNAMYAMSRSGALAICSFIPFFNSALQGLIEISIIMIIVQGFDAIIGFKIRSVFKTIGPLLTSVGNLACVIILYMSFLQ